MLCKKPYRQGVQEFGCGQCMPCRYNRRKLWAHRMVLEAHKHASNCFITLTYSPENYPANGSLDPNHVKNFIKRLRDYVKPVKVRYFFVGEYGDETERAHYHGAIFGLGPEALDLFEKAWSMGFVYVGDLTFHSAEYIAKYVSKKMTKKDDSRLNGRYPEFARMSLKPGIGAAAMDDVLDAVTREGGADKILSDMDVPSQLQYGKKKMPLGRYLKRKLREKYGFSDPGTPKELLQKIAEDRWLELQGMSQEERKLEADQKKQKILNFETKVKIFTKKGSL